MHDPKNDIADDAEIQSFVEKCLTDRHKKALADAVSDVMDGAYYWMESEAISHILSIATRRVARFWERLLDGDDHAASELLADEDGRRYRSLGYGAGKPWPNLIHGHLFEVGGMEMRRKIVDAYPELLKDQRILDLEATVDGLTQQIKEQDDEICRLHNL